MLNEETLMTNELVTGQIVNSKWSYLLPATKAGSDPLVIDVRGVTGVPMVDGSTQVGVQLSYSLFVCCEHGIGLLNPRYGAGYGKGCGCAGFCLW